MSLTHFEHIKVNLDTSVAARIPRRRPPGGWQGPQDVAMKLSQVFL